MKKIVQIAFIILSVGILGSCSQKQAQVEQKENIYTTLVVSRENATLENIFPATIKGQQDIEIRPRIDGFIDEIYIDEGAEVKKGERLFKINSPQAEQVLTTAKAGLKSAEAQVNTAQMNVDRIRPLAEKGIVGQVQLEKAKDALQTALAGLAQAEAALKNAQATIGWTHVISPVDGLIGEIPYRLGSLVSSVNVLTTVANTSNIYAHFSLNEKELAVYLNNLKGETQQEKINNAPEISLILADGSIYEEKGKLETITGSLNIRTGSANFRVEFPNKKGLLRSGASAKVITPRIVENAFIIPQKSTFAQLNKRVAYVVENDTVRQRVVEVLPTPDGHNYAVTQGLSEGERIVAEGIITLRNGQKISYQDLAVNQ